MLIQLENISNWTLVNWKYWEKECQNQAELLVSRSEQMKSPLCNYVFENIQNI